MSLLAVALLFASADPSPLPHAHAHNDYLHTHPLTDALDQGFCSVEADIFLVDGEFRVGHDRESLRPGKTLESMYLDPLYARVKAHHGHVYDRKSPFTLLIDIKADGRAVYAELAKRLPKYADVLTSYDASRRNKVKPGAITIVLSGDRPADALQAESKRLAFVDGHLDEITGERSDWLNPLVSDDFGARFKWHGVGAMSPEDRATLDASVAKVHRAGAKLRFWGAPDNEATWRTLYSAGVDVINTDNLAGLRRFFLEK